MLYDNQQSELVKRGNIDLKNEENLQKEKVRVIILEVKWKFKVNRVMEGVI